MASVVISAGICGFTTHVEAHQESMREATVSITSDCSYVTKLAEELHTVDPFREISFRGEGPLTLALGAKHCAHPACPVPSGIIKAIEVASGLALPADVHMTISRD